MPTSPTTDELLALLRADRITVLTGAGCSAESGVPTFRDAQTGLWAKYRAEELATPEAFRRNPKLVWEWYAWRRQLVAKAEPNPAHLALVELEQRCPSFLLITQNVDGLHQRAGSRQIVELHGNIGRTKCFDCDRGAESWADDGAIPPRCSHCGGHLRPDVVWFGEALPADALQTAIRGARDCELLLSIGTSGLVEPAASLPFEALARGAKVLEINRDPTPLSAAATWTIHEPAGEALPRLMHIAWPEKRV